MGTVFFVGDGAIFFNKIIPPRQFSFVTGSWANPCFLVYRLRWSRRFAPSSIHFIIWRKHLNSLRRVSTLRLAPLYLADFNFLYRILHTSCRGVSCMTCLFMFVWWVFSTSEELKFGCEISFPQGAPEEPGARLRVLDSPFLVCFENWRLHCQMKLQN